MPLRAEERRVSVPTMTGAAMNITIKQGKSNADAPEFSDYCGDCGDYMNSKMIGKDRVARCVSCHKKGA